LLSSELKQLKVLETKYEALKEASYSEETVIFKVTELFNEILTKRFEKEGEATVAIFSKYITKIIAKAYKDSPQALSEVLKDTIAQSIAKEIENNKDSMIDSLYPIMGGMISKYVSQAIKEMMQNINAKIEDGLSMDKYKRKLKSKMTGVSESELLVQESNLASISSLMLIQKESGLLIAEAQISKNEVYDPHMVASMASAIRDFINDWIQQNSSHDEVQILTYGEATLYIESAGSVYMIAFLNKEPEPELRGKINYFFASLVKEYSPFFRSFEGDDSDVELEALSKKMSIYLENQIPIGIEKTKPKKQNYSKYFFLSVILIYIIYLAYLGTISYKEYLLEEKIFTQTKEKIEISYEKDNIYLSGYLKNIDNNIEIEKLIRQEGNENIINHLHLPLSILLKTEAKKRKELFRKLNKDFLFVENTLKEKVLKSKQELNNLALKLQNTEYTLKSMKEKFSIELNKFRQKREKIAKIINQKLNKVFKSSPYYIPSENALDFAKVNIFNVGESKYNKKTIKILREEFSKYIRVLTPYKEYISKIIIEGHSDSRGIYKKNLQLSTQRALNVKANFLTLQVVKDYNMQSLLDIESFAIKEVSKDKTNLYKEASRKIKIKFDLKESKILNTLGKIIND